MELRTDLPAIFEEFAEQRKNSFLHSNQEYDRKFQPFSSV